MNNSLTNSTTNFFNYSASYTKVYIQTVSPINLNVYLIEAKSENGCLLSLDKIILCGQLCDTL